MYDSLLSWARENVINTALAQSRLIVRRNAPQFSLSRNISLQRDSLAWEAGAARELRAAAGKTVCSSLMRLDAILFLLLLLLLLTLRPPLLQMQSNRHRRRRRLHYRCPAGRRHLLWFHCFVE